MRVIIIVSNPNKDSLSVYAATKCHRTLELRGIESNFTHLDSHGFTPTLTQEEIVRRMSFDTQILNIQKLISHTNVLSLFFPDWWGFPPALLVGWMQRVFTPGFAFSYEGKEFMPKTTAPLLSSLRLTLHISTDDSNAKKIQAHYQEMTSQICATSGISCPSISILSHTHQSSTHEKNEWISKGLQNILDALD